MGSIAAKKLALESSTACAWREGGLLSGNSNESFRWILSNNVTTRISQKAAQSLYRRGAVVEKKCTDNMCSGRNAPDPMFGRFKTLFVKFP